MPSSMTAFARHVVETDMGPLAMELRSVNYRYLDCNIKLPPQLTAMESEVRDALRQRLGRGKVDCALEFLTDTDNSESLMLDHKRLEELLSLCADIESRATQLAPNSALELLSFPGVCHTKTANATTIEPPARQLLEETLKQFIESRQQEGGQLCAHIESRLQMIETHLAALAERVPEIKQQQRDRLQAKLSDIEVEVDTNRLEQELVHLAQKADIDEELDRLTTHIAAVRQAMKNSSPIGRRLDFLMQEFNREANTIASKSGDAALTHHAVEVKVLIEQIREQVQNIE